MRPLLLISTILFLGLARGLAADVPERLPGRAPLGWATAEGKLSGGAGGQCIEISDAAALSDAVKSVDGKIVYVKGTITLKDPLRVGSNTTLVGIGSDAKLVGGGLHLRKVHNVIIRNLAITQAGDAVNIEESHHVWIDHCDLSKCRDGLIDVKRGSDFITVSWNHFHDHHKTCLLGHSDKEDIRKIDTGHLRVTYHHNFFDGTETRHPRVRFAEGVHVFNNFFRGNQYGVASVMDAGVIVEGNYFEDVRQPTLTVYGDSPDPGRLVERKNVYVRSGSPQSRGTVDDKAIGYGYELDDADQIPEIVRKGAGPTTVSSPSSP